MTSAKQRVANRANSLKSTGPKTSAGKGRTSGNARTHGLSASLPLQALDPVVRELSSLIAQDGVPLDLAQEIGHKILSYESNQTYQGQLFLQSQEYLLAQLSVQSAMRDSFGVELDMMADLINEQRYVLGEVKKSDYKFVINMQHRMLRLTLRRLKRQELAHAKRVHNSVRYLKRSSNQLIKTLKDLNK